MRKLSALIMVLILLLCLSGNAMAAADKITTTATGYTCAEDVVHKIVNGIVVNWGARGETCSFLSASAQNYYSARDTETWETLSEKDGGTGISDAYTSELYKALQSLMQTRHTKKTSYGETRNLYCYTDCLLGDYEHISSFYSGKIISGTWDSGSTWNREHTWPSSKTPSGKPKNGTVSEATDIMTLRPTATSENSSRGNTAFGESSGYYDPGESVRGDCARVVLYGYVRWGNTGMMWGSAGVMENLDILLKWMEEDPVDTWEMGRNDSVQSITGVRNVFVDYPEFAWMLFGQEVPENMVTPSGNATASHTHSYISVITTAATCTDNGILTYTCTCGDSYTEAISATGHSHEAVITAPTCTDRGFTTYTCACGDNYVDDYVPATGHKWDDGAVTKEPTESEKGELVRTCASCKQTKTETIPELGHTHSYAETVTAPTCTKQGYTTYTCPCGQQYSDDFVNALGHHYDTTITPPTCTQQGYSTHVCTVCGDTYADTYTAALGHSFEAAVTAPTCTEQGFTTFICACGEQYIGDTVNALGHSDDDQNWLCDRCQLPLCDHADTQLRDNCDPTCTTEGYTGDTYCSQCNQRMTEGTAIPATGHQNTENRNKLDATCGKAGHTGDTYCTDCGELVSSGSVIPATGEHKFSDWISNEVWNCRTCTVCGYEEVETVEPTPAPSQGNWVSVVIAVSAGVLLAGGGSAWYVLRKKKR